MKKYLIVLSCLLAGSHFSFAQGLYDTDQITVIEITFEEVNWDEILDQYYSTGDGERLMATVEINGESFDSVGVRYRGGGTYNANYLKNPINIKLDYLKNHDFQGYEVIKLNNGVKDPSWLREVMGYELLRNYMEAPMANYASVYVNGNFHGVYSNVESINSKFFEERFLSNPDNPRFEGSPDYNFDELIPPPFGCNVGHGAALELLGPNDLCYFSHYDIQSSIGWADLRAMTELLVNTPDNAREFLDLDRFVWMSAFNSLTANLDSYLGASPRNYYIFQADNGHWIPVVEDLNECFARFPWASIPASGDPQPALSFFTTLDPFLGSDDAEKPLLGALFGNDTFKRMYVAHMRTMIEEMFTSGYFENRIETLQNLIAAEVASDVNHIYSASDFEENVNGTVIDASDGEDAYGLVPLMDGRIQHLLGLPEFQATPPSISGVSASPDMPAAGTNVDVTASVSGAGTVFLGIRNNLTDIFELVEMFDDGTHGDGSAGDGIFGATLTAEVGGFQYYIYAENEDAGMFSPQRAEFEFYSLSTSGEVVINELMARNQTTVADQDGEFDDWAEIFNNSNNSVSLTGWFLSDDPSNLQKWVFPTGAVLDPGQRLIVWVDDDELQSGLHTSFNLNGDGEALILAMPDGTIADQVIFGQQQVDVSLGRCPDGTGNFVPLSPTFNTSNTSACLNPTDELTEVLNIQLFPNPASDRVKIETNIDRPIPARLRSLLGTTLFSFELSNSNVLNVSQLPVGIYFVEAQGQVIGKVCVMR